MILAADIGPTTARVALFDSSGQRLVRLETFRTLEHDCAAELVQRFLGSMPWSRIDAACVAVDVPWPVRAHELAEVFEIPVVVVVDGPERQSHRLRELARIAAERLLRTAPTRRLQRTLSR